jgi:thiamine-phosphate pyrophosphorylase
LKLPHPPLLLITDRRQALLPLPEIVEAALEAGCRWISVREKDLSADEQIGLARNLRLLMHGAGARLTLHGDIPPSTSATAVLDGIHLPNGARPSTARPWREQGKSVGRSIHTVAQAKADPSDLDYLIAGPAYDTPSKPGYGPSLGPEGISQFARCTVLPIVAIGGIDPARAGALINAGAAGIAVMGSVMRAPDPERLVRDLIAALNEGRDYPRPR